MTRTSWEQAAWERQEVLALLRVNRAMDLVEVLGLDLPLPEAPLATRVEHEYRGYHTIPRVRGVAV